MWVQSSGWSTSRREITRRADIRRCDQHHRKTLISLLLTCPRNHIDSASQMPLPLNRASGRNASSRSLGFALSHATKVCYWCQGPHQGNGVGWCQRKTCRLRTKHIRIAVGKLKQVQNDKSIEISSTSTSTNFASLAQIQAILP